MASVLVTCGGRWVGLILQLRQAMGSVAALRGGRLLVADRSAANAAGYFADASLVVPEVSHPLYVDCLLDICRQHDVRVVIPHLDMDLDRLAPHLPRFQEMATTVVCPPAELLELCRDKRRLEQLACAEGLPYPRTYPAELLREELFPLFAKRARGSASEGAGVCRSLAEAHAALARYPNLLFQEWIADDEASIDVYISVRGCCTVRVPRLRTQVIGGEAVQSCTFRSPPLTELVDRTVEALIRRGLRGPLNVQAFVGEQPRLLEVNARLGSASVLSNEATGGRFFTSVLAEACGEVCDGSPDDYQEDLQMTRYWGEIYHHGSRLVQLFPGRNENR